MRKSLILQASSLHESGSLKEVAGSCPHAEISQREILKSKTLEQLANDGYLISNDF